MSALLSVVDEIRDACAVACADAAAHRQDRAHVWEQVCERKAAIWRRRREVMARIADKEQGKEWCAYFAAREDEAFARVAMWVALAAEDAEEALLWRDRARRAAGWWRHWADRLHVPERVRTWGETV